LLFRSVIMALETARITIINSGAPGFEIHRP